MLKSKEEPIRKTLVIDNVVEDNLSTNVVESKKEKTHKVKAPLKPKNKKVKIKKVKVKKVKTKKVKSKIIVKAPKGLVTPKKVVIQKVEFPEFADILEMKEFCVLCGLNKVDGYILATKRKKIEFLSWMSENFHKAELPTSITSISNPFSPSAGIGEMQTSNEGNIKAALSILRKPEVANNTIELPPLKTSDNTNEMPNALNQMQDFAKQNEVTQKKQEVTFGNVDLDNYGETILNCINESFSVKFHGAMQMSELNTVLSSAANIYKYEVANDNQGKHIKASDNNGNTIRIPKYGSLPIA